MKKYFLLSCAFLLIAGCNQADVSGKDVSTKEYKPVLLFAENEVGIETTNFVKTYNSIENVYILNIKTNNRVVLDKPEALKYRWISDLKRVDNDSFSFLISASPHFAQFFKYNLQGQQIVAYPVADECYFLESYPPELQEKAKAKCGYNPEFATFEDSLMNVQKQVRPTFDFLLPGENSTKSEETFEVKINSALTPYIFHLVSPSESLDGKIEIFKDKQASKPLQTITLKPNFQITGDLPHVFEVQDINFDGFMDIGTPTDYGGAKWETSQFWLFDKKTGKFVTSPLTKDFEKIVHNEIKFDTQNKLITTTNFCGVLTCDRNTYKVENGHVKLIEEDHQEQPYDDGDIQPRCAITIKKYGIKVEEQKQTIDHECEGYFGL